MDPNVALVVLILGALLIYVEFIFPGRVIPGVIGGLLAMLGLSRLSTHVHWYVAIATLVPFAIITFLLFSIAIRARAHKRAI